MCPHAPLWSIAWNLTSAVLRPFWSLLDAFHSIHNKVWVQPLYLHLPIVALLMTYKRSHSCHVLKSVHSSCHNKSCSWVGHCWQGPIINIAKQTARQSPRALTAPSYKRKWKRRWIELFESSDAREGIGSHPNLQAYFWGKRKFHDIVSHHIYIRFIQNDLSWKIEVFYKGSEDASHNDVQVIYCWVKIQMGLLGFRLKYYCSAHFWISWI